MERDYEREGLVEKSTLSMLQTMADEKPEDFLKLLGKYRTDAPLDKETAERFKRLGLLDPTGNVQRSVKEALRRVHFRE